ncbi:MAG: hypothetical protein HY207_05555 [Nitrospirae bacterium]|nr:hypothetical protein [Nitrospirota bacterium]
MPEDRSQERIEEDIAVHIFTASAALVGVCLTVIGLFRISDRLKDVSNVGQAFLALDALAFLVSCVLSYHALKTRRRKRQHKVESLADIVFLVALGMMAVACSLIAYELV